MQRAQLSNDESSFTKFNTNITVLLHLSLCIQGLGYIYGETQVEIQFCSCITAVLSVMCYSLWWQYLVSRCVGEGVSIVLQEQ